MSSRPRLTAAIVLKSCGWRERRPGFALRGSWHALGTECTECRHLASGDLRPRRSKCLRQGYYASSLRFYRFADRGALIEAVTRPTASPWLWHDRQCRRAAKLERGLATTDLDPGIWREGKVAHPEDDRRAVDGAGADHAVLRRVSDELAEGWVDAQPPASRRVCVAATSENL